MSTKGHESSSLYDSFNARWIPADQIAETFIPPVAFKSICAPISIKIVGPRGSGKTSILKMLQTPALENWRHREADKYRKLVDYTAIFIPSDVVWRKQYEALGYGFLSDGECETLKRAVFSGQVMDAVAKAMRDRFDTTCETIVKHRRLKADAKVVNNFVKRLSKMWGLQPELPTFESLRSAIRAKTLEVYAFSNRERHLSFEERSRRFSEFEFLHIDGIEAAYAAVSEFNSAFGESDGMWAFMFDELELAPKWLKKRLEDLLRSSYPNVILKISISPYGGASPNIATTSAMKDHDFKIVTLANKHKLRSKSFANAIFTQLVKARFGPADAPSPEDLLGLSILNGDRFNRTGIQAYSTGSAHQNMFDGIAKSDPSVRDYLKKMGINIHDLKADPKVASLIRKIFPTLVLRQFFLKEFGESGSIMRGRKSYSIYSGTDTFFAASEANPRWLIGMASSLLDRVSNQDQRISDSEQAQQIYDTAESFCSLLKTIMIDPSNLNDERTLLDILDKIGEYFFESLMGQVFIPEPVATFVVDSEVCEKIRTALGIALNQGAIVHVPKREGASNTVDTLIGSRFRLCYLLAPRYKINTRIGPSVNLSRILSGDKSSTDSNDSCQPHADPEMGGGFYQQDLFG